MDSHPAVGALGDRTYQRVRRPQVPSDKAIENEGKRYHAIRCTLRAMDHQPVIVSARGDLRLFARRPSDSEREPLLDLSYVALSVVSVHGANWHALLAQISRVCLALMSSRFPSNKQTYEVIVTAKVVCTIPSSGM